MGIQFVVDVGVPADIIGDGPQRPDILVLTGGLAAVPEDGRWHSPRVIRFQRGDTALGRCRTNPVRGRWLGVLQCVSPRLQNE